ncbi:type I restriction-modification system methyltransferase subunit [Saccharicrinis fermentans DSM 9555 = JCM 21142]|uniref:site-specific DNA-methyltransferase (adenine-specific) n=1 Tax=Saccharicrinis fermentans DSM 9555 = JCM 21142 TaxID=869213 RepID=W7Y3Y8_9BACT|nr:type I restriction-modification system methyltransferase subunit [Saccharicrinis fermentans DSM 9555 = JCM 21142]
MNIAQIEINLQKLIATINKETFIFDLLLAYGLPKNAITLLKKGNRNMSKTEGEISWKKKLFFKEEQNADLHLTISKLVNNTTHNERFVVVTDYKTLLAIDTKTKDKLDCQIKDLAKHYDFFLPWAGMEKAQHANENPAEVKAAEKMAKLFDVIKKDNPDDSPEFIHGLNIFLSRLLFCFFAEDTHIFEDNQFTNAIDSHTQVDGSDLNTYLDKLFTVLNTPESKRENLPEYLNTFPFVNGGLFRETVPSPVFSRSSRAALLNSGDQDWSAINPDIFGSMFQAVISVDQRGSLGQHYTSVPNIMKVIEPLFLNELYEEFEKAGKDQKKLKVLLNRIHNLKIFDPACGSGNFLIIAYKELRLLEMKIFKAGGMMALSGIQLSQFYGIEIDDFAGEIAKLALWLAEHQINVEFHKEFGRTNPTLPLSEAGHIVQGNATRVNWEEVCPKIEDDEIYI